MGEPIQNEFKQLLESRRFSEERARLHQLGERLRKRLAVVFKAEAPPDDQKIISPPNTNGHTEKFNRILTMWLDLQRAIAKAKKEQSESLTVPWDCKDKEISRLWEEITRPENLPALWEWLYQSASGEQEIWAQQAFQECQIRSEEKKL